MKQAAQMINSAQLRQFAPLGKLSDDDAQELLRTSITIQLSPGTPVFNQDDVDKQVFYLLKGKVELRGENKKTIIDAGTKEARKPMGHHLPGHISAKAVEESILVSFDADMLDLFLNWTNPNAYVVNEMETTKDHEWMNQLLQSRGLLRFSESQINTLLDRMNEVHFNAGETVISQDGDDEFYYVIKKGRATVSRKPDSHAKEIKLAELREGDAFGEESILTSSTRGATVTMQEDGNLMRLSKQDFSELLAEPLLDTISWDEAQAMAATGALFLDIRLEEEFNALNIPGSINIPLPLLRLKLKQLNQKRKYIVYCDDGSRSSVAAFLLNRHGFDTFILDGGMATAIPHLAIKQMPQMEQDDPAEEAEPSNAQASNQADVENSEEQNEAASTAEETVSQTNQGNEFCSLADYWGSTVDEVSNGSFADSETLHNVEKTTVTPASDYKPVVTEINKPAQKVTAKATPKAKITPAQTNPYDSSHLLRNSLIGITVIGLVAAFSMQKLAPEKVMQSEITPVATIIETPIVESKLTTSAEIAPVFTIDESPLTAQETQQILTQAVQMDVMIEESDIFASEEDELFQLQPSISPAVEAPKETALDPATRGFLE